MSYICLINIKDKLIGGSDRTSIIKRNILGSFAIRGASVLISFLMVPLTIGYISQELYGVWLTLSSVLTWIGFLDMGFGQGLKNKLTEAIAKDDWSRAKSLVSTTYFMMILIFLPVGIILECSIHIINWSRLLNVNLIYESQIEKVMYVLIAFVCIQMVINVFISVVAAFQKVALSNLFNTIGNFLALIIIYVLTKTCPPSLMAMAFSVGAMPILVTMVVSVIFYSSKFKIISPSYFFIDKTKIKDLFSLGYKFFIANIQVVILYQSTNILISNVSSPLQVTSYNIAYKYLNIAMMVYCIITSPLWPAYTDAYFKKDFQWMKNIRAKMTKILLVSIVMCVLMMFVSNFVYKIWVGENVVIPKMMTFLVGIYVMIYCWVNLNATIIAGIGVMKLNTYILIFGMFAHIPLSLFLSKFIGVYGVLLSMIMINLIYGAVYNIQVNKILNKTATGIWIK